MFSVVLVLTAYTWKGYVGPSVMVGEVQTLRSTVAAPVAGRLSQVAVVAYQKVKAGQVVGMIQPVELGVLDAQVALARARIDQVRINYEPALRQQNNEVNYAGLRMNWLDARTQLAIQLARTNFLAGELDRAMRFQAGIGTNGVTVRATDGPGGFASLADVQRAQMAYDETVASIAERQKALNEINEILERLAPVERRLDDEIPAGVRSAILVEERNLQLLETQIAPRPVLASIDGVVTLIQHQAGEHVQSGDALLVITAETPRAILAYVKQPIDDATRPGRSIEVRSRAGDRKVGKAQISEIGPAMEAIPSTLLPPRGAGAPVEVGLPVRLTVPSELRLRPGELVDLRPID